MHLRAALLVCLTILGSMGITLAYLTQNERYALFSQDKALFIFDKKNSTLNYCDNQNCQLITPQVSNEFSPLLTGGVPTQTALVNMPIQKDMVVTNPSLQQHSSLQTIQNLQPQQQVMMLPCVPQPQSHKGLLPAASIKKVSVNKEIKNTDNQSTEEEEELSQEEEENEEEYFEEEGE